MAIELNTPPTPEYPADQTPIKTLRDPATASALPTPTTVTPVTSITVETVPTLPADTHTYPTVSKAGVTTNWDNLNAVTGGTFADLNNTTKNFLATPSAAGLDSNFNSNTGTNKSVYDAATQVAGLSISDVNYWPLVFGYGKPKDFADQTSVNTSANTLMVANKHASDIAQMHTDFNASNNQDGSAITILPANLALSAIQNTDGSATLTFTWTWAGTEASIDGFAIAFYSTPTNPNGAVHTISPSDSLMVVPAHARKVVVHSTPANVWYTYGIAAYRSVNTNVNSSGMILSAIVQTNNFQPSTDVNYTGKINNVPAATLTANAQDAITYATNALAATDVILADNKFDSKERAGVRVQWDTLLAEKSGLDSQATSFGITTEKTNYDSTFQAMANYFNGGTAWTSGTPAWLADTTSASIDINRTTFRSTVSNFLTARTALFAKVADVASTMATWPNTTGAGKPEDNATKNIIYQASSAPTGGTYTTKDIWINTSSNPPVVYSWNGTAWVASSNYTTNTTQLTDDANLGLKATWSYISGTGKPVDNATKNQGTSSAANPTPGSGSNGDSHYNTATGVLWTNVGGTWITSADKTSLNTAAGIANQGTFATTSQITSGNATTLIGTAALPNSVVGNLDASKITTGTFASGVAYTGTLDTSGYVKVTGATSYAGAYNTILANTSGNYANGVQSWGTYAGVIGNGVGNGHGGQFIGAGSGDGIFAQANGSGWAGYFGSGEVYINGNIYLYGNGSGNGFAYTLNADQLMGYYPSDFAGVSHWHGNYPSTITTDSNSSANCSSSAYYFCCYNIGNYMFQGFNGNGVRLTTSSDSRLKHDISPEILGTSFIKQLLPVTYRLNRDPTLKHHGFIAQDVQPLIEGPFTDSLKTVNEDGTFGMDYLSLIAPLVKTIQELITRIEVLENNHA